MNLTVTELRRHPNRVMDMLIHTREITVTRYGKPIAIIQRMPRRKPSLEEMKKHPAFGMWKDREDMKDPVAWVRKIRRPRRLPWH